MSDHPALNRLSGLDASFLYLETSTNLLHVCGLVLLDVSTIPGGYHFDRFRAAVGERAARTPTLRHMVHDPLLNLDHPVWREDTDFDIAHHVFRTTVAPPGGPEELSEVCADIASRALDRSRPLWEMWVIEGLASGQVALVAKMHHATIDGVSGMSLVADLCSLAPDSAPLSDLAPRPAPTRPRPSDLDIAVDGFLGFVRRPGRLLDLVPGSVAMVTNWIERSKIGRAMPAPFSAPRTSFNTSIGAARAVAFTRLSLAEVKEVKNLVGATVNDVVLATCSGALRRYLTKRDELPAESLVAMVPVSVHDRTDYASTNKVSGMFADLSSDIADPLERVRAIAERGRIAKEHHATLSAEVLLDWAQLAPAATIGLVMRAYHRLGLAARHPVIHNLVVSNVAGPPMPMYLLGARITGFYPLGPVFDGAGLNITVVSREGHIDVGLIACRELLPDVWDLADAVTDAFDELLAAARHPDPSDE